MPSSSVRLFIRAESRSQCELMNIHNFLEESFCLQKRCWNLTVSTPLVIEGETKVAYALAIYRAFRKLGSPEELGAFAIRVRDH
jgi:hypothetical protein